MQRLIYFILIIASLCSVSWCIYRDIKIEKQYTGDLRNRIVGARLQKDGIAPYFYKWKKGDSTRYYDPNNFDTLKVSNITATPFLHQLFYPIADLSQRKISKIWLAVEYLLLGLMVILAFSLAKTTQQRLAVIITVSLFLLTQAWKGQVSVGQVYLLIPFFSLFFFYSVTKNHKIFAPIAGISAALLLLIRPNTIFFLLPFFILVKKYTSAYMSILFASLLLVVILTLIPSQNRLYWKSYRLAMEEQLKSHQSLGATKQENEPNPDYQDWEGWSSKEITKEYEKSPYDFPKEHGNIFVFVNNAFHTKLPLWLLSLTALLAILALALLFYRYTTPISKVNLYSIAIFAFLIYMLTDIFSPVHRFLYYGVQWLFPLFLVAACFEKKYLWIYGCIITGIIFNSIGLRFIPMENTLGEYIIFLFLIIFIFKYKPNPSV